MAAGGARAAAGERKRHIGMLMAHSESDPEFIALPNRTRAWREVDERLHRRGPARSARSTADGQVRPGRARSSITRVPRRNNATRLLSDGSPRYSSAYMSPILVRSACS